MGFNSCYQSVRTNLLTQDLVPTLKTTFSVVSIEELHQNSNVSTKSQNQNKVFASNFNQYPENNKKFNKGPNPNVKCSHCNKIGHTVESVLSWLAILLVLNKEPIKETSLIVL
jgi:hypothetical protein